AGQPAPARGRDAGQSQERGRRGCRQEPRDRGRSRADYVRGPTDGRHYRTGDPSAHPADGADVRPARARAHRCGEPAEGEVAGAFYFYTFQVSLPGLTGQSSIHGWWLLDRPVKPGDDSTVSVCAMECVRRLKRCAISKITAGRTSSIRTSSR